MNYKKQYENLITRAQNRTLDGYSEKHHILPRCLGGTDEIENLARLTGREHFVAHVLLVKMYPEENGLIYAVNMMCRFNKKQERSKNRMYGWLREELSKQISKKNKGHTRAIGQGNSQYGTCWISDVENEVSKKIQKEELEEYLKQGWIKGRNRKKVECFECKTKFVPIGKEFTCGSVCRLSRNKKSGKASHIFRKEYRKGWTHTEEAKQKIGAPRDSRSSKKRIMAAVA